MRPLIWVLLLLGGSYFIVSVFKPHWLMTRPISSSIDLTPSATATKVIPEGKVFSYRDAARTAMPSVVNIFTNKKNKTDNPLLERFFDEEDSDASLGSGVIVSSDGLILTNHHVIESATTIEVALSDGRKVKASLVGSDPETDLAVLRIALNDLPAIQFAPENQLEIGDVVLAIGNPFGVGQTLTMGVVSALERNHLGINTFENFIQTDAAINPGNSGGALIDTRGALVGINAAIFSQSGGSEGIGFAIPISIARQVLDGILSEGRVTRGWLGIGLQDLNAELATSLGVEGVDEAVVITRILAKGPAERAGLKVGDIVTQIDQKTIKNTSEFVQLVSQSKPGASLRLKVIRNGNNLSLDAKLGLRPPANSR